MRNCCASSKKYPGDRGEQLKLKKTARVAFLELYDSLERGLKRHAPRDYITYMSKRLVRGWGDQRVFLRTPPHRIMHSIEANCAYWKEGYREPVTQSAVDRIMNTYHDFQDPYQIATVAEQLERFLLLIHREQFELQKRALSDHLVRTWQLFVRYHSMATVSEEFCCKFGITPEQWVKVCFLCWHVSMRQGSGSFLLKLIEHPQIGISQETLESFLKHSARSPEEIGRRFREMRKDEPYEYHSLVRSCFFERPIVRFSDGTMIVPHTHLLFLHAGEGLYRLASKLDEFGPKFGDSFEAYVGMVLAEVKRAKRIIGSNELKRASKTKSCDFLVEGESTLILVECKACTFTAKRLHDRAIRNNNSTDKVAKGLEQLYATARDLESGRLDSLGVDRGKATIGIVLTFGEIPAANSGWYFEEFFLKRAGQKLGRAVYPSRQMTRRPIVLGIESFETLVRVLNCGSKTLEALYDEREARGYFTTGDWGIWLDSLGSDYAEGKPELGFLGKLKSGFLSELGMGVDRDGRERKLDIRRGGRVVSESPT